MMPGMGQLNRRSVVTAGLGAVGVAVVDSLLGCSRSGSPAAPTATSAATSPQDEPTEGPVVGGWSRVNLGFVSSYILLRGSEAAVVDLGTAGTGGSGIVAGLKAAGVGWDAVRHVFLTHKHPDHIGGLASVAPNVKATFYTGKGDLAAEGTSVPIRPVADGDEIFGLRIIATPGHTLGHVSIYDPASKVLVAGDALITTFGLAGSDPHYTDDAAKAAASVKKLAVLDVAAILPGHGAPLTSGAAEHLRSLAASL
jgi:glyoxylase-like metal-dependent hydrolase (beta-lactamase superfamily II)